MGLEWQAVFLRECAREALRLERTHLDQHVGQFLPGLFPLARLVEILGGDPRSVEQNRLETLASGRHQAGLPTSLAAATRR